MKLRNKKTGEVIDAGCRTTLKGNFWITRSGGGKPIYMNFYESLAELNEEWEDYRLGEPYIGDEATAKFVRAWAKHWGFEVVTAHIYTGSVELVGWTEPSTRCREIDILGGFVSGALEEGKDYTIDELCGEEEE